MNDKNKKLIWVAVFAADIVATFRERAANMGTGNAINNVAPMIESASHLADLVVREMKTTPEAMRH